MGIKVENPKAHDRYGLSAKPDQGVVITEVRKHAYLDRIGVVPGDIILQIDEHTLADIQDFLESVKKIRLKSSIIILLQRQGNIYYLTVELDT
jgi:serine protease Do